MRIDTADEATRYDAAMPPLDPEIVWRMRLVLVLVLGLIGVFTIWGLMWAWRRHLRRDRELHHKRTRRWNWGEGEDPWQASERRMREEQ